MWLLSRTYGLKIVRELHNINRARNVGGLSQLHRKCRQTKPKCRLWTIGAQYPAMYSVMLMLGWAVFITTHRTAYLLTYMYYYYSVTLQSLQAVWGRAWRNCYLLKISKQQLTRIMPWVDTEERYRAGNIYSEMEIRQHLVRLLIYDKRYSWVG